MVDIHELENCGAVVGDGDIIVGRDHHLVETLGTEGGPQGTGDGSSCQNVTLVKKRQTLQLILCYSNKLLESILDILISLYLRCLITVIQWNLVNFSSFKSIVTSEPNQDISFKNF